MALSYTTSLRLPAEMRERYEALARITGRTRNGLMIEAMEQFIERQMSEIALIQEGIRQLDAGEGIAHDDVVARLISKGMLSAEFLERDQAQHIGV